MDSDQEAFMNEWRLVGAFIGLALVCLIAYATIGP